ncbi:alpha-glucan family phosphorylase [Thiohalobacter sp. IOR34]|uniref:alpha-glucan family phosphorylase n=1 Tax=Thiohalobacter sp. IOR34 TaxID=3057176 RepID=UPI0025B1D3B1|nr:alpha-glucan family phosphorylase [Thiohalobacter sp. IOR34]WJW74536.1 alpha-glucan family phosphorylase [Thiohalobacter sp. IOR34]
MAGTRYSLEVQPRLPERLVRLRELADDLFYSWDRQVRGLFYRLDPELWAQCGHSPKLFLRRVAQERLDRAAEDRIFLEDYNRTLSAYDTYLEKQLRKGIEEYLDPEQDLIAYFCAEFGLHESLPIYSGGLGILAGDHCKAASDLGIPFVAVGMLYRQGYFTQTIDGHGNQIAHYTPTHFEDLAIHPATVEGGQELHVFIDLPGRRVMLKVWEAKAGHIRLYLLDSDLPENQEADRAITYQLYGGDITTRIQQEIVLGIGGVRALRALGLKPSVWHINEGHAAFMVLERCREWVKQSDLDFASALELVAAGTVFTTHTPVAAGHDIFDHDLISTYFSDYIKELGIEMDEFLALGASPNNQGGFNQTTLALHGSRFHNGVSRIHGGVASQMEAYVWPQIPPEENPIRHVTNGVHVPTFLARDWANLYDIRFGREWRNELFNPDYWSRIDEIPDHSFWSLRQSLKADLLEEVRRRVTLQHQRNGCSDALVERLTRYLTPHETDVLIVGFARRFATYKRATLLFSDPDRLARLVNDAERPIIFMFAGKAHPSDMPGQHLIQVIHDFSRRPEFAGRIILIEGYDMALARKLVTGVDVWLNTPEYPMEASGTSGEKAGINGVLNLSVLDGWWGEGYNGENGWAITPHGPQYDAAYRDQEESTELLDILENQLIPLYYERNGHGYPEGWVRMSKASIRSILPQFNSERMVMDYIRDFYSPAARQQRALADNGHAGARDLAAWKRKVWATWPQVSLRRLDPPVAEVTAGSPLEIRVAARLHGLSAKDVTLECVVGVEDSHGEFQVRECFSFEADGTGRDGETLFCLQLLPPLPGLQYYKLRMYPSHPLLSHPFETGCMLWL